MKLIYNIISVLFITISFYSFSEDLKYNYSSDSSRFIPRSHFQSITINSGYSFANQRNNNVLRTFEDTSSSVFNFGRTQPVISFTHDIALSNAFSLSYTLGYQRSVIDMNRRSFGRNMFMAFINPRLTTFRRKNIETYFQLRLGLVYDDKKLEDLKSKRLYHYLPPTLKAYTGFTPLGLSINLYNNVRINFEWSVWSYETFNIGIKYNIVPTNFNKSVKNTIIHSKVKV